MSSENPASGRLLIVAAPSGGGKSSLVNALLEEDSRLVLSVSLTTRAPRGGERDGEWYRFVDHAEFERLIEEGAFLEHARVFDHYYGTHAQTVKRHMEQGRDVILEIDWQGARQVRAAMEDCRSVFILPPSLEVLRQRLTGRAIDSESVIQRRMREARSEISHWDEFDYLVVNDEFSQALQDLRAIVRSLRLGSRRQQLQHASLLAELLGNG